MTAETNMPMTGNSKHEIAFIDTSVSGYETLLAGVRDDVEVVLIDGTHNGLAQIAEALAGRSGIDAVHLFTHGAPGALQLGTLQLTEEKLAAYGAELAVLRDSLSDGGDLLLYGCDVAQGARGESFLAALSAATGADVAASDDPSGSTLLGGDWELETVAGAIDAAPALTQAGQVSFSGLLGLTKFDDLGLIWSGQRETSMTAGIWKFGSSVAVNLLLASNDDGLPVYLNSDEGSTSEYAVIMNSALAGDPSVVTGAVTYSMKLDSGGSFQLNSLMIGQLPIATASVTISAYSNGLLVVTEAVNLISSDSTGDIRYTLSANDVNGRYGALSFTSAFENITELRFAFTSTADLHLDDIDISTAVPDVTAPVFSSAAVNGATLVMTYTDAHYLNGVNIPAAGDFTVVAGGATVAVSSVAVNPATKQVTLTLAQAVLVGQAVTVAYDTAGDTTNAIQDVSGNDAASLSATAVTNNTPDTTSPVFASAAVDGNTLVMSYTEATTLNAANTAGTGAFAVTAGGSPVAVTGVSVDANAKTVTLTLASPVTYGQAVTVAYTDPTGGNDANAIQDAAGNDAASLSATSVTNNTLDTVGPVVTSVSVPSGASYKAGQTLSFTVNFDENITVAGTDSELALTIGSTARAAEYASSTATSITYTYTVQTGDNDGNGITVGALSLGTSTIRDASSNDATLTLNSVGSTSAVLVDTTAPAVTGNISVPSNGSYKAGQTLSFTVTLDENVTVTGSDSTLGLTIGSTARAASYVSATANTITYEYTVQAGDTDADGISVGSIALGSTTVLDAAGNSADLTLTGHKPSTTAVLVDTTAPAVSGNITPPANDTYIVGATMTFTVTFDENVTLSGSASSLGLTVGGTARSAAFASSTANSITYSYTVQAGDSDADGIAVTGIALNGGTIRDAAGNDATVSLSGHLPTLTGVLADGAAPAVSGNIGVPANASYRAGQTLSFTVTFDDDVTVAGTDSVLGLTIGSTARDATFASKTANTITYSYTVQAGETDANGIAVGSIALGTTTIKDAAGNDADLTLASHVPSTTGILVDTTAPVVSSVSVPSNATYVAGQNLDFTVNFGENVTVTGTASTLGLTIGSTARNAVLLSSSGSTATYRYTVQAGDVDANGITVGSLALNSDTIRDAAGNDAVLTLNSVGATGSVLVDGTVPTVSGTVTAPGNNTYVVGETLEFTVTFNENVDLNGSPSTLGLTVGSTARNATVTATTGNSITYSYTVQNGDNDADGIAVTGISLNGGTIRDSAGNNADLSLTGHLPVLTGVLVDGGPPSVSGNISAPADGSYRTGQVLSFTVTFDENVTVTGTDSVLGLTIGSTARDAMFASKTANTITYTYTVQAGDTDANGIAVGSITLGGTTIKDIAGNDAVLTLASHVPSTTGILVDTTAPVVNSVSVPSNATYVAGQNLDFMVTFSEGVTVTGTASTLGLTIGSTARDAVWLSGSGSTATYRYTVQAGDVDANGITVGSLALNGDTIRDAAGNDAVLTLNSVGATGSVLVDGTVPTVSSTVTAPGNNTYVVGETLEFTVTFNENVDLNGSPSTLGLTVGSTARNATVTATTGNSITYSYTVQNGDNDADGIAVTGISLNGGTIRDSAGNNADLSLTGHLPVLTGVLVDGGPPSVSGNISVPADGSYRTGQVLSFTVTFDENVTVTGTDSVLGLTIGSTARDATFASKTANTITYTYTVQAGDADANGIAVGSITLGGTTIKDIAGNDAVLTLASHVPSTTGILVDTTAPVVNSVSVPSNATYVAGQNLDFTVTFSEGVTVTGTDSSLGLTIGSTARNAVLLSSSGSTATYRYTVQAGDVDADGITVGSLALNGDTTRDAAGNDAVLTLNSVGATGSVRVDATVPSVTGTITAPANDTYVVGETLEFTVTFDENVTLNGSPSTLDLMIGSTARSAAVTSSTGNSITYSYVVQSGDNDSDGIAVTGISLNGGTIRDGAGNNASLSLTGHMPALTGVLVDTAGPALLTATVNGATMVLTYSDAHQLDAVNVPAASAFGVLVAGSPVLVSAVVVNAAAHTVTLTLASAVSNGQAVSVAYADPSAGDDANAIQDAAGNDAASLASTAVVNNTPSPETPPATGTVDGVPVQTGTVTNPDGSTGQVITVPVVTPSRVEQVGNNTVADIPLVKDAGGTSLLTVQVPVGVGLQASGGGQAKPAGNSLTDLIREIRAHTTAGSADQNQLTGGGSGFLDALSSDTPLLVQTIVVTGNGGSSGTPLGIIGQAPETSSVQTALVIDARGLPNGAALELQNVEFAAVIGTATVTGGAGSQHVWGDGASQNIFLGADDDVLHGGAGDDIVGSAGGNDMIYGDEGNDLVFGGEGDDLLDGGAGHDTARFSGCSDGYSLRMQDGELVMTARAGSDGADTVTAVETLRFTGGQSSSTDAVLARLYEGVLHRTASAAEVAYWQEVHVHGTSLHDVAAAIVNSAEAQQGGAISNSAFVASLYQNVLGRAVSGGEDAYWTALLEGGADRAAIALGFVNSAEKLASTLDVDFNHSDVAVLLRMYHAMFGRAPDEAGLNFWLARHEDGLSLGDIADAFTVSAEAEGSLQQGNAGFIDQLYQTALERMPSAAEKALLLEQLQQGVFDRGQMLLNVAESAESIALVGSVSTSLNLL